MLTRASAAKPARNWDDARRPRQTAIPIAAIAPGDLSAERSNRRTAHSFAM